MTSMAKDDPAIPAANKVTDGGLRSKYKKFHKTAKKTVDDNRLGQVPADIGANEADSAFFPIQTEAIDERDDFAVLKSRLAKGGADAPLGQVHATDQDIKWLHNKLKNEQFAKFNEWITQKYNLSDPGTAAFVAKIYPDYFKMREDMIHQEAEAQLRLALLVERGPQSSEDIQLLWLIESGQYTPKKGALWDPRGKAESYDMQYERGFFSPYKFLAPTKAVRERSQDKPFSTFALLEDTPIAGDGSSLLGRTLGGVRSAINP